MPKVGVIGSLVWDEIHGRDPAGGVVEEWGGIAYALAALDAALAPGWELVPLIKVGADMAPQARNFLRELRTVSRDARFIAVPEPNNRVVLRYQSTDRRCERMAGGVPAWTWPDLGPLVKDLDAIYVNFISGFEMCLWTAEHLRRGFAGPIMADLHSLFLGMQADGLRSLQPLAEPERWFACFDVVQMNEDELHQLSPEPLPLAARALGCGVSLFVVTLGARGAAWVAAPGFHRLSDRSRSVRDSAAIRTALSPAAEVAVLDPTGCGDVFGASLAGRLLAGDQVSEALVAANAAAGRNAAYRGATSLAGHLRGELVSR